MMVFSYSIGAIHSRTRALQIFSLPCFGELFCKPGRSDDVDEIFMAHMAWGKVDDLEIIW